MQVLVTRHTTNAIAAALLSGLLLAGQAGAHKLRGVETWVHVAQPGVELSITASDKETARALGLSESSVDLTGWNEAWRVEADGDDRSRERTSRVGLECRT